VYADPSDARVAAIDHGLIVGDGVFEALKVSAAGPFAVRRHLDRMTRSARALDLPDPDHHVVREAIEEVLAGRTWEDGRVRITYTGGRGPLGSQAAYGPTTLVVAAEPRQLSPAITTVVTAPWRRNEHGALTGVKSTSYAENVRGLAFAKKHGATEAIFLNVAGGLCEGTGSNVFCVFGDRVVTPPLSAGPLAGITREVLLEWCVIEETDITPGEAEGADEMFITSSTRDVQAVGQWDEHAFDAPGPWTRRIAAEFARRSAEMIDP
jgi:branched-chain amino acid aminotransferase